MNDLYEKLLRFAGSGSPRSRIAAVTLLAAVFLLLAGVRLLPRFVQDLTVDDPLNQVY